MKPQLYLTRNMIKFTTLFFHRRTGPLSPSPVVLVRYIPTQVLNRSAQQ